MKRLVFCITALIISIASSAQNQGALAMNTHYVPYTMSDSLVKTFSNSEIPGVTFLVSSDLKENTIYISTNYSGKYNVRFVDYFGRSSVVFKNQSSNIAIDLAHFERSIFVMNISDEKNNKLISSQVLNLKRRIY
ncbi:MAG: hypothetical protein JXB34_12000 [Bacteroidales bacterium]|nr:hypothetical protein [Bacteroidales bacterium]